MRSILFVTLSFLSALAFAVDSSEFQGQWKRCVNHFPGYSYMTAMTFENDTFFSAAVVFQSEDCSENMIDAQVARGTFTIQSNHIDLHVKDQQTGEVTTVYGILALENAESLCVSEMVNSIEDRPTVLSCEQKLVRLK